ncbi:hypothetical protein EC988_006868 [Linderina pennispora]|nr:hypothetical protein EC988_006868 [Linderina pennispora]
MRSMGSQHQQHGGEKPIKADQPETAWDRTLQEALDQAKRELDLERRLAETDSPAKPEPKPEPEPEEDNDGDQSVDYLTTVGRVMVELPHQLEGFFEHGLEPGIYSEQLRFIERTHTGLHLSSRTQYMGMARVLRIAMSAYFSNPTLTVVQIRQVPVSDSPPAEEQEEATDGWKGPHGADAAAATQNKRFEVYVRWVFEGMPRHADLIGGGGSMYEGEFRYRLDQRSGLIAAHEVTAIHPTPPTAVLSSSGLARLAGWFSPRGSLSLTKKTPRNCL